MSPADQQTYVATLASDFERELAKASGLEEALGGPEATDLALREAWAPTIELARSIPTIPIRFAKRRAAQDSTPNLGEGLCGATLITLLGAEAVVTASNDVKPGPPVSQPYGDAGMVTASTNNAELVLGTTHTSDAGVVTKFKVRITVSPCPDASGKFTAMTTAEISATKDGIGQNGTLDISIDGQVDDNANLTSTDTNFRMQFADFAGGRGSSSICQAVTRGRRSPGSRSTGPAER